MPSHNFAPMDRLDDYDFLLQHVFCVEDRPWLKAIPSNDTCRMLLDQADHLCRTVIAPLRTQGDADGAQLVDGAVIAPPGFTDAYRKIVDAGMHASTISEELGGIGLSPLLGQFIEEMMAGSNTAMLMYYGFAAPAVHVIQRFGTPWLADILVPKLVSGAWVATMALTEAHAGSDLAQVRTLATEMADGTYTISGGKIFISGGDHDLTDNIVHVVLARRVDAAGNSSPGLGGLNVFIVPKFNLDAGTRNNVDVIGLERKMGLHANPTCALLFNGSVGHLLSGGPVSRAQGMAPLFEMMNHARLSTANGSVGAAAAAAELAHGYALERRSGRASSSIAAKDSPPDAIIDHPDVARMILSTWAIVEGSRATIAWTNLLIEEGRHHPDSETRQNSTKIAHLMTPLLKAFVSDQAYLACDHCLQIFGGHGYIRDTGIEQFTRDLRIGRIYERLFGKSAGGVAQLACG